MKIIKLCAVIGFAMWILTAAAHSALGQPPTVTHYRDIQVWYGSAFAADGTTVVTSNLQLTDHITIDLATQVSNTYPDVRVTSQIGNWVVNIDDMDWVLGTPENLPAEQNLRNALTAALGSATFDAPIDRGTREYFLTSWSTDDGQGNQTDHEGYARVRYFELNARAANTCSGIQFAGFHEPIGGADATGGTPTNPIRAFNLRSNIPVKMTLTDCAGNPITTGIHTIQVVKVINGTLSGNPINGVSTDGAATGNRFRLTNAAAGRWHFNLDPRATGMTQGVWQIRVTLSDGSQHIVYIELRERFSPFLLPRG